MILIDKIKVSIPIFKIRSLVTHFTPRKPTVFEETLVDLVNQYGNDSRYRQANLEHFLQEILCIPDVEDMVRPSLEDLIVNPRVLKCGKDSSSLEHIRIGDLSLTKTGREMLVKGYLPAEEAQHEIEDFYDPIKMKLCSNSNVTFSRRNEPGELKIDEDNFTDVFPQDLISKSIRKRDFGWLTNQTEIREIARSSSTTYWHELSGDIKVSLDGRISFEFSDTDYRDYFKHLQRDWVQDFLSSIFKSQEASFAHDETLNFQEISSEISQVLNPRDIVNEFKSTENETHFVTYCDSVQHFITPQANCLVVCFGHEPEDPANWIEWNDESNGALVFLGKGSPIKNCRYLNSARGNVFVNNFRLTFNNECLTIPLAYSLKKDSQAINLDLLYNLLDKTITKARDPEAVLIQLFWQPGDVVWKTLFDKYIKTAPGDLAEKVTTIESYVQRLLHIRGDKKFDTWIKDTHDLILMHLRENQGSYQINEVRKCLEIINKPYLVRWRSELLRELIGTIKTPEDLETLWKLLDLFRETDEAKAFLFPSHLFSTKVLSEFLAKFSDDDFGEFLKDRTELETILAKLKRVENLLKQAVACPLDRFTSLSQFQNSVKKVELGGVIELCHTWQTEYEKLVSQLAATCSFKAMEPIERIHANVVEYAVFVKNFANQVPRSFTRIYVVDTNVFVDDPQILSKFSSSDYIVVSKKVIDELDGFKKRKGIQDQARQAMKQILSFKNQNPRKIHFEESNPLLLPRDYHNSADNLILSVALKYKLSNPILLTSDKGLTLKATAEKIRAKSLFEFSKARQVAKTSNKRSGRRK